MIQISSVAKIFSGRAILKNVNLTFESAKTHVLLGASGSGKTTLLRMMMGLVYPETGFIYLDGEKMEPQTQRTLARKIGYVLQDGGLFPHLTARGNVSLVAKGLGWTVERIEKRLEELSQVVGLDMNALKRYPGQLSGGQRQRAAVMRAVFLDPSVLLLDEPLGALDPLIRVRLQSELRDIFFNLGKLVVLVTHDIGEAAFFGDTVTLLHDGTVLQHGAFSELLHAPKDPYVTEFVQAQRVLHRLEHIK